jgi:hypothetical protein
MNISSAQYTLDIDGSTKVSIAAIIDGKPLSVPLDPSNRHYSEIMRQVEAGDLVIQEAE